MKQLFQRYIARCVVYLMAILWLNNYVYSQAFKSSIPDESRFSKVVLAEKLDEPTEMCVLDKDRVLFIQRKGEVRLFNNKSHELKTIAHIPVNTNYTNSDGKELMSEHGLMGLNKDPNFANNHWIYLYYTSKKGDYSVLSRFTMDGEKLLLESEKELLKVNRLQEDCCHTGGSIAWDKIGNLYLSTGDNTNPHGSDGFSPVDEAIGRRPWDAQKSASNTNDLRGKIIRIKPTPEGSYTIPEGNLFPVGLTKTRPEIFSMGHRNPYRISVDQQTGYVYWGEVGPDANKPNPERGSEGYDEVGQARKAGNFGWPYFVADNKPYNRYDFVNKKSGEKWDAEKPTNTSPNNTGLTELPPAQKAFIWYPYGESKEFPLVGSGGRNAMAGPVFYKEHFKNAERPFPDYYDGKLLTYDWMRGWIMAVSMDKDGNYQAMERLMPNHKFSSPIDMDFSTTGDLYILEYGSSWFSENDDARLVRIEYNSGNRKPNIQMTANKRSGAIPFALSLSSKGTSDADGDLLKYQWTLVSKSNKSFRQTISTPNAQVVLQKAGIYQVRLTVTDSKGGVSSQTMEVSAGNEPPVLNFDITKGNRSFFFPNKSIDYQVNVKDKEDGSLANGRISPDQVSVKFDYLTEGYDRNIIAQGHQSAEIKSKGLKLIEQSDCQSCHNKDKKSVGPTYLAVASKYKGSKIALEILSQKVINGGSGVWGETAMSAHPAISKEDAAEMVKYILSLADEAQKILPVKGSFTTKVARDDRGYGTYLLRASYEDQGYKDLAPQKAEQTFVLRNAKVPVHGFDSYFNVNKVTLEGESIVTPSKSGAYMALKQIDLRDIKSLKVFTAVPKTEMMAVGAKIEVRLDAPDGKIIGESPFIEPSEGFLAKPLNIELIPTDGLHDIYLVFQNPKAEGHPLLILFNTNFKSIDSSNDDEKVTLEDYVGKYRMKGLPFEFIVVKIVDGHLSIDAGNQTADLKQTNTPDKFDDGGRGFFIFKRNEEEQVVGLVLDTMGVKFIGTKE